MRAHFLPKDPAWKVFEQFRTPKIYPAGQMVYFQGDDPVEFYYLVSGTVKIFLSSENGTQRTLAVMESGNIFGEASFFDELERVSSACATEESQIIVIDKALLQSCFSRAPELAISMLKYIGRTVRMLSDQLDNMTFLPADKRIARVLTNYAGAEKNAGVCCTQEELGNMTGVSRVTVSRILNAFARKGWIQIQYRTLHILQAQKLAAFAADEAARL